MVRRTRLLALACLAALSAAAACQLVAGISDETGSTNFPADGATDATSETGADAGDAGPLCALSHPPPRKETPDVGGLPLFFALQHVLTLTDAGIVGYDIDGRCSHANADIPCKGAPDDYDGGIDNAFLGNALGFFKNFTQTADPIVATTNDNITAGTQSVYLGLYGYNRQADDGNVALAVAMSPGLRSTGCADASVEAGPGGPAFDGCDVWSIGDAPEVSPGKLADVVMGYVTNHRLVVPFGAKPLLLRFAGTELRLVDATVVATLVERSDDAGAGAYELVDGIVTGRATAADLIVSTAHAIFRLAGQTSVICTDPAKVKLMRDNICLNRDLRAAGDDPSAACDSLSVGFGFVAPPAAQGLPGGAFTTFDCGTVDSTCPPQ